MGRSLKNIAHVFSITQSYQLVSWDLAFLAVVSCSLYISVLHILKIQVCDKLLAGMIVTN